MLSARPLASQYPVLKVRAAGRLRAARQGDILPYPGRRGGVFPRLHISYITMRGRVGGTCADRPSPSASGRPESDIAHEAAAMGRHTDPPTRSQRTGRRRRCRTAGRPPLSIFAKQGACPEDASPGPLKRSPRLIEEGIRPGALDKGARAIGRENQFARPGAVRSTMQPIGASRPSKALRRSAPDQPRRPSAPPGPSQSPIPARGADFAG